MGAFLVKDIMLLLRDRSELLVLLAMPFLLIAILGFSLRGIFSGDLEALEMDVAFVTLDDEAQAVEAIQNEIDAMGIPQADAEALKQAAASISPQTLLISLLESENLNGLITLQRMDPAQAAESLEDEAIDAAITIPQGFTEASLRNMLLGSSGAADIQMLAADLNSSKANVLHSILEEFVQTVNFEAAISRLAGGAVATTEPAGGIETITSRPPISSFQFYTIGMAVMFVLFVGSTIAGQANLEQKHMVFDRILLSNRPPLLYLGSKAIAA
ncbi:MAG TPA: ABC transporter permease, partial [Planococcus sp. (in: firmicutes)]|nr:ABC transporter permease [Planococcus sp. (in: firmicutes)]